MSLSGMWRTVDENTHNPTSIVKIWKPANSGLYRGKILYLYPQKDLKRVCYHCPAPYTGEKVVGMDFITGLKYSDENFYDSGTIIDPKTGNEYKLNVTQLTPDRIKLRGYLGIPLFGRTQFWGRFKGSIAQLKKSENVKHA